EAGMAFVMAHEIAHVLLDHGSERLSQQMLVGGVGTLLNAYLDARDVKGEGLYRAAYGVATGVGFLLPFSRLQESEADELGLRLMAEAGYDPRQAVEVWRRMAKAGGGQPPEFLSTHPSHETRIEDLQAKMDKALALYGRTDPAPVARLPEPPRPSRRPDTATAAALRLGPGDVQGEPLGVQVEPTAGGEGARVVFEFAFSHDLYVKSVQLTGPGVQSKELPVNAGVPGRASRKLRADLPGLRRGTYTLTFIGRSTGRSLRIPIAYTIE
ncbi:MAG TPA: M48 family metallopeptidase, partial [Planctomycetota bacterium]|nr:M48 family metallopeptidase [Planctomycetota bacterium]